MSVDLSFELPQEEDISELGELFLFHDESGQGSIDVVDFGNVLTRMGQTFRQVEVESLLSEVDANNNGKLDFAEFLTLMVRKDVEFDVTSSVKTAFKTLDPSGSGLIPIEKVKETLRSQKLELDDEEMNLILESAGVLGSAEIDYDFFVTAIFSRPG